MASGAEMVTTPGEEPTSTPTATGQQAPSTPTPAAPGPLKRTTFTVLPPA